MKSRRKFDLEVEPGRVLRRFTEDEAVDLSEQWIGVFGRQAQDANLKAYLWHTFSFGAYPSVRGHEAELQYRQQVAPEFVVLSNDRHSALLTDVLPTRCGFVDDYLVFPTNFAWTMAYTHEDGWLGPYFAKHTAYDSLVAHAKKSALAAQRKAKVKAEEVERAKREGWL